MTSTAISIQEIIDTAVEHNFAPDIYFTTWDLLATWQMDSLLALGLKPGHQLLDVGCGAMRLGLSAIDYLDDGNYCGIDAFASYVDLAHALAQRSAIQKNYHLLHDQHFQFASFNRSFDFAIAQSVFTHLSLEDIDRCMANLTVVMKPGSQFLFTYLVGAAPTYGFLYRGLQIMRRPYIEDAAYFERLAHKYGCRFSHPDLQHPTQKVGLYTF